MKTMVIMGLVASLFGGGLLAALNVTALKVKGQEIMAAVDDYQTEQQIEHWDVVFRGELKTLNADLATKEREQVRFEREKRITEATLERKQAELARHEQAFNEFGASVRDAGSDGTIRAFGRRYTAAEGRRQLEQFAEELLKERRELTAVEKDLQRRTEQLTALRDALAARRRALAAKREEGEQMIAERRIAELRAESRDLGEGDARLNTLLEQMRLAQDEARADQVPAMSSLAAASVAIGRRASNQDTLSFSDVTAFEQRFERQSEVTALVDTVLEPANDSL